MSKIRAQNQKNLTSYRLVLPKNFRIGNWKSLFVSFVSSCWTETDSKNPENENVSWLTLSLILGLRRARFGRCWAAHSAGDAYAAHFLNDNKSVNSIIPKKSAYNSDPKHTKRKRQNSKFLVNLSTEEIGKRPGIGIWRENIGHLNTRESCFSVLPDLLVTVSSDICISSKGKSAEQDNAHKIHSFSRLIFPRFSKSLQKSSLFVPKYGTTSFSREFY